MTKTNCKGCGRVMDETETHLGNYCEDCANDILIYPILFSDLDEKTKDILMTSVCERIIKLEKADKRTKEYLLMRDSYIQASNILEEVHFKVEKVQSEISVLSDMVCEMKAIFQKGWGVPK